MINTHNDFLLGSSGNDISPLLPVHITSREQAYRTAAWIKAMAPVLPSDGTGHSFDEIEEAINDT